MEPDPDWPDSPLDAVDAAFTALARDPNPITLDLDKLRGGNDLPGGVMTLPALRDWLLTRPRAYPERDAVWRELILRARTREPQWTVAAVGMAMPALRRYAGRLHVGWSGDAYDTDAEILTGFLTALRDRVDLDKAAPYASLCMAAWRAGYELRRRDGQTVPLDDVEHVAGPRTPSVPYGHPDLLVHRAVMLGILDASDEQPYIDLRLGHRAIEPVAASMGITVDALRMRARRIDTRITHALANGLLTGIPSLRAAAHITASAQHRARTRAGRAASTHRDRSTPADPIAA
ncbi:hypothetical protein CSH63_23820 [Micromonospora tulbaghiae]|uniref:DNA-directed RNA polymerase specialized sigma subunit, sigma24 family n=1 Tax=Micromonospora tulbaghiae TaxID=479978 RepID=A0A386WR82_9ACTN|nr:hypothetical protein [Micromonospora tulbaghiae]AYF30422.1 hypothetical protein CSH63_23820 [Micromonospora tulbaghiae]